MSATVVIVPGLRDHVSDHWQTLLAHRLSRWVCVPRLGRTVLSCVAWVEALQATIAAVEGPVFIAAHSAGVMMVVNWARKYRREIAGALLATPPDLATPMPAPYPSLEALALHGWLPVPRTALPFPSLVAASSNDPLSRPERIAQLARSWGSAHLDVGPVGHLNSASGFGEWPRALELLRDLGLPAASVATREQVPAP
jgi:uncharacterized protein